LSVGIGEGGREGGEEREKERERERNRERGGLQNPQWVATGLLSALGALGSHVGPVAWI
jgi:hypothetical protein